MHMGGRSERDDGRTDANREGPHLGGEGGGGEILIAFSEQAALHPHRPVVARWVFSSWNDVL